MKSIANTVDTCSLFLVKKKLAATSALKHNYQKHCQRDKAAQKLFLTAKRALTFDGQALQDSITAVLN